jgi:molecular chaperone Hsp33
MNMNASMNSVTRFVFDDLDIRGALVQLSDTWQAMQHLRGYTPPVAELLGEMAAVAALIGSNLKTPGRLTFQAQGSGDVSLLVVDCNEQLELRGMARSAANSTAAAPLSELLGEGQLLLSLQSDTETQPYQSYVPLSGENIAEIFEHYLAQSEQQPARLWLDADNHHAVGMFLQTLPGSDREAPDGDGWNRVQHLAATLRPGELLLPPEMLLGRLFPEETIRLFEPRPVLYHCPRDEIKVRNLLISLGRAEVESILAEHGEIVIRDDICNHEYRFDADILYLFNKLH